MTLEAQQIDPPFRDPVSSVLKWVLLAVALLTFALMAWATTATYGLAPPQPDRFVGVVVDVTSQKNAQERQRLLAREADHRVKNIFANFHSMISLSARSARTPKEMAQALRGRMDALLRAKDLVRPGIMGTEHESERTTVDALVRTVLQPYEDGSPDRIGIGRRITSL